MFLVGRVTWVNQKFGSVADVGVRAAPLMVNGKAQFLVAQLATGWVEHVFHLSLFHPER